MALRVCFLEDELRKKFNIMTFRVEAPGFLGPLTTAERRSAGMDKRCMQREHPCGRANPTTTTELNESERQRQIKRTWALAVALGRWVTNPLPGIRGVSRGRERKNSEALTDARALRLEPNRHTREGTLGCSA